MRLRSRCPRRAPCAAGETTPATAKRTEMALLLRRLIDTYDRAGLPPAYPARELLANEVRCPLADHAP